MLKPEDILVQDEHLVVVNKPAGLVVHRSRMAADVDTTLLEELGRLLEGPLLPVHRLDRATSGVMLLARHTSAAGHLGKQLMAHSMDKCYLAVCRGWPRSPGEILYDLPDEDGSRKQAALTCYHVLAQASVPIAINKYPSQRYALLQIWPKTGRYRQIRRHFHHISHHLIGDTSHGRTEHNHLFRDHFGCERLLLHAWSLRFAHPDSGQTMTIEAPLDPVFSRIRDQLFADRLPLQPAPVPLSQWPVPAVF